MVGSLALLVTSGCAGLFGFDGTSQSTGTHANGGIRHPAVLPLAGDGYVVPSPWRDRHSNFGSDEIVGAVIRAARSVAQTHPGALAVVGDVSRRGGGGSAEHRSHQSGRDVDIFYYATNGVGRPEPPRSVMFHFDKMGRARRWSPPKGVVAPTAAVPDVRFDFARNWQFVRALLLDPDVEVQWIFVQRDLAIRLIQYGTLKGDDPGLLARASAIVRQPSDSEPHDDHMHVRVYCEPKDRTVGCVDRGPERWWKKRWKYMDPPFGRPHGADVGAAVSDVLRDRVPVVAGAASVAS